MALEWSQKCCLCGRNVTSYHNPDPIRDGEQDCCSECNAFLVCRVRRKCFEMEAKARAEYIRALRGMTYDELEAELGVGKTDDGTR